MPASTSTLRNSSHYRLHCNPIFGRLGAALNAIVAVLLFFGGGRGENLTFTLSLAYVIIVNSLFGHEFRNMS